jgi:hypothetical protein
MSVEFQQEPVAPKGAEALQFGEVEFAGKRYIFSKPVNVYCFQRLGSWVYDCPSLHITAHNEDRMMALFDFRNAVQFAYDELVGKPDDELNKETIAYRDFLSENIKVEEAPA